MNLKKHGFEFLSIFIAVISAFALNNWNENRKSDKSENKILIEISNGLEKDIIDIKQNKRGHTYGLYASTYFKNLFINTNVSSDSILFHYKNLTRDYISIQNTAGYETLKSRGLELIKNDLLRLQIISLYEYDYEILRKLEEEYSEMQFHQNYFKEINQSLAPSFIFDDNTQITGIELPLHITEAKKKTILSYLIKIRSNRKYIMGYYAQVEKKIFDVQKSLNKVIDNND